MSDLPARRAGFLVAGALFLACEAPREQPAPEPQGDPTPISGIYEVQGETTPLGVPAGSGSARRIAGSVILKQEGDHYAATFELDTTFPGAEQPVQADVIGSGEGIVADRLLTGTAHTQLVVSTVPGVDTGFAFVPRVVGARIVSTSRTEIAPDGTVVIELENRPDAGDDYLPTRTRLTGVRIADVAGANADVAAGSR